MLTRSILGTSTVSGTLGVTTGGALTQSGPLAVTGTTTLAAGAGNDVTLANGGNNFGTVAVTSGRNVAITDANALDLGTSTISRNFGRHHKRRHHRQRECSGNGSDHIGRRLR